VNRIKGDLSRVAYRELELVGRGMRVPDGMGVVVTSEETWDDDDGSERIVVEDVSDGSDDTISVVVVVIDGAVTVAGGGGAEWKMLGEYMRCYWRKKNKLERVMMTVVRTVVNVVKGSSTREEVRGP
jgi:hypothetical protein